MPTKTIPIPTLTKKDKARFWKKVDKTPGLGPFGDCWEWTAYRLPSGYGRFGINGTAHTSHRISYLLHNGPIEHGLWVLHKCDNPACVNPEHLWEGTGGDNQRDCARKKRSNKPSGSDHWMKIHPEKVNKGISHGRAKLTEEQVLEIRSKYTTGRYTLRTLGLEYKVSFYTISEIIRRKTWTHI